MSTGGCSTAGIGSTSAASSTTSSTTTPMPPPSSKPYRLALVDFDGTICKDGAINEALMRTLKQGEFDSIWVFTQRNMLASHCNLVAMYGMNEWKVGTDEGETPLEQATLAWGIERMRKDWRLSIQGVSTTTDRYCSGLGEPHERMGEPGRFYEQYLRPYERDLSSRADKTVPSVHDEVYGARRAAEEGLFGGPTYSSFPKEKNAQFQHLLEYIDERLPWVDERGMPGIPKLQGSSPQYRGVLPYLFDDQPLFVDGIRDLLQRDAELNSRFPCVCILVRPFSLTHEELRHHMGARRRRNKWLTLKAQRKLVCGLADVAVPSRSGEDLLGPGISAVDKLLKAMEMLPDEPQNNNERARFHLDACERMQKVVGDSFQGDVALTQLSRADAVMASLVDEPEQKFCAVLQTCCAAFERRVRALDSGAAAGQAGWDEDEGAGVMMLPGPGDTRVAWRLSQVSLEGAEVEGLRTNSARAKGGTDW